MKFSSVFIAPLFAFLIVNTVIARPPQRIIIQFDSFLSSEQKQTLNDQIKLIIKTEYILLPHSTDQRWIVVMNPVLDDLSLEKVIKAINQLEHVKYAEPDYVMEVFQ